MKAYLQAQRDCWHFFALMALAIMLAGCAQLGIQAPQTFNQKALAAQNTVTAIAKSAITLRQAGKLSDADRDNVVASLTSAQSGIDLAAMVFRTNPEAGMTKLDTSIAILTALQAYLATKEQK